MSKTATYKGKTYLLRFSGKTKFGMKAKLAFLDGSKEFWVPLDQVTEGGGMVTERQADAGYGRGRAVRTDCCGYPCPVTGQKCTPSNPCHDCE